MRREIKFRGYSTDSNQWVYGFYREHSVYHRCGKCVDHTNYFIDPGKGGSEFVKPETVGQFTGLKDINGNEIYEDDIVEMRITTAVEKDGVYSYRRCVVFTIEKGLVLWGDNMTIEDADSLYQTLQWKDCKIITNIHDQPNYQKLNRNNNTRS